MVSIVDTLTIMSAILIIMYFVHSVWVFERKFLIKLIFHFYNWAIPFGIFLYISVYFVLIILSLKSYYLRPAPPLMLSVTELGLEGVLGNCNQVRTLQTASDIFINRHYRTIGLPIHNRHESYGHILNILNLQRLQELGVINSWWRYLILKQHGTFIGGADGLMTNFVDTVAVQCKSKQTQGYTGMTDLSKLHWKYTNTSDIIQVLYYEVEAYNKSCKFLARYKNPELFDFLNGDCFFNKELTEGELLAFKHFMNQYLLSYNPEYAGYISDLYDQDPGNWVNMLREGGPKQVSNELTERVNLIREFRANYKPRIDPLLQLSIKTPSDIMVNTVTQSYSPSDILRRRIGSPWSE